MKKRTIIAFGLLSIILLGVLMFIPTKLEGSGYSDYPREINLMIGQRFYMPDNTDRYITDRYITFSGKDDSTFIISEAIVCESRFGQGMTTIEYRLHFGDKIWVFGGLGRMYRAVRGSSYIIVLEMVGDYYP